MLPLLSTEDARLAQSLANVGMANAASALSFMIGETVRFTPPVFGQLMPFPTEEEGPITVLLTPFIGDVLQDGYMIMQPSHAQRMADALLPSPGKDDSVRKSALLEIDNIVSASIATRLGDLLDFMVMGDVPRLLIKSQDEAFPYIDARIKDLPNSLYCTTYLRANRLQVDALYICIFKEKFLALMAPKMQNPEAIKRLEEHEKSLHVYMKQEAIKQDFKNPLTGHNK